LRRKQQTMPIISVAAIDEREFATRTPGNVIRPKSDSPDDRG